MEHATVARLTALVAASALVARGPVNRQSDAPSQRSQVQPSAVRPPCIRSNVVAGWHNADRSAVARRKASAVARAEATSASRVVKLNGPRLGGSCEWQYALASPGCALRGFEFALGPAGQR